MDFTALAELQRGSHGQVVVALVRLGANAFRDVLERERRRSGRLDSELRLLLERLRKFAESATIILSLADEGHYVLEYLPDLLKAAADIECALLATATDLSKLASGID